MRIFIMRRVFVALLYLTIFNFLVFATSDPWTELSSINIGDAMTHSIELNKNGEPIVAWDLYFKNGLSVMRWNGSKWELIEEKSKSGRIANIQTTSLHPALAVKKTGEPCLAWQSQGNIYYLSWNGKSWISLEKSGLGIGISNVSGGGKAYWPSLALDSHDNPYIAWIEEYGVKSYLVLKYWDGKKWTELKNGNSDKGISDNVSNVDHPRILIGRNDKPIIVCCQNNTEGQSPRIFIKQWNTNKWDELGKAESESVLVSNNVGYDSKPAIALDSSNNIYVAWTLTPRAELGGSINERILLKKWDGRRWLEFGKSGSGMGFINSDVFKVCNLNIATKGVDSPVLFWTNDDASKLYIYMWNGNGWVQKVMKNGIFENLIVRGNQNGKICVSWVDSSIEPKILHVGMLN